MALTAGLPSCGDAIVTTPRPPSSRTSRRVMARLIRPMSEDDEEQDPRERGCSAEVELAPADLVQIQRDRQPLLIGAAVAVLVVHARLVEDLEAADGRGDDDEDERRPQRRERDAPELAERVRSVDHRGFVVIARHRLHGGEEDEGVVAGPAEVDHRRDRDVAPERVLVPRDRGQSDVGEEGVHETVVVAEEVAEDQRDRNGCHDEGQQHAHAPEGLRADVAVEHGGDEQREDDLRH